ncbi:HNH endonuclease [Streptomyces sp. NPDC058412]|uniref:HNH endonuclease n=1 Tax=Streptomyces sp. NPDC058412 TaxID=3346486 RepID=UPI0036686450
MWPLGRPRHGARDSYEACISRTREITRRTRLRAAADAVEAAGEAYRLGAAAGSLHALRPEEFQIPGIGQDEKAVTWVYENGMVKGGPGRAIYDELMASPKHGQCPLCGHGIVSQLDHFMPKSSYPALCVDPLNLIPACSDCNKTKGDTKATRAEELPLHPYFDDIDSEPWLAARVIHEDGSVRLEFYVSPPDSWDQVLTDRARNHFRLFNLRKTYALQANWYIGEIRGRLRGILTRGGADAVRAELLEGADSSLSERPNSWIGVTYRSLAEDSAFCEGAFGA